MTGDYAVLVQRHQSLLDQLTPQRYRHTVAVGQRVADHVAGAPAGVRHDLVLAGMLHDIGYATGWAHTGLHPLDGATELRRRGFSPLVCDLVATHTAAAGEAKLRGLGAKVLDPFLVDLPGIQTYRDLITWADLHTSPTGEPIAVDRRLADILDRYPAGSVVHDNIAAHSAELLRVGTASTWWAASGRR